MNELLSIVPYNFLFGLYNFLPPLLVLARGGGAVEVGVVNAVYLLGLLFAPLVWSRFCRVTDRRYLVVLGYLGTLAGLLMMSRAGLLLPATFLVTFMSQATYIATLSEVKRKEGSLGESLGRLEQAGRIAWAFGLLAGFLGVQLLGPQQLVWFSMGAGLLMLPLITRAIGEKNIASTFIDGFQELGDFRTWVMSTVGQMELTTPRLKNDPQAYSFYALGMVYSVASGIILSQVPTLLEQEFGAASLAYLCFFVDALCSAAVYRRAGILRWKNYRIGYPLRAIAFLMLLASIHFHSMPLFLLVYVFNGLSWGFIFMFFEYAGLKMGEEVFGTFLSLRMLAYSAASAASGFLVESWGFLPVFALGTLVFLLTALSHATFENRRLEVETEEAGETLEQPVRQAGEQASHNA